MNRIVIFALSIFLLLVTEIASLLGQEITDLTILRQGGYVLFFRHASAPGGAPPGGSGNDMGGAPETMWWAQCDPLVSRQLNAQGRNEALTTGRAMKRLGLRVSRAGTSEYCRCYESAVLMNLGVPLTYSTTLTMSVYPGSNNGRGMDSLAMPPLPAGTIAVYNTHGIAFADTLYDRIAQLAWSDAAVYRQRTGARPEFVGFIRYATWTRVTSVAQGRDEKYGDTPLPVSVQPNLSDNVLRVYSHSTQPFSVEVFNALGQKVFSAPLVTASLTVDISTWAQTVYTVVVTEGKNRYSERFIKAE
jgi:hypothetical protein